jgi:hypothetical protein
MLCSFSRMSSMPSDRRAEAPSLGSFVLGLSRRTAGRRLDLGLGFFGDGGGLVGL